MFEGFEIVEEENDYIVVDKDQPGYTRKTIVIPEKIVTLNYDYEKLLYQNKIVTNQLTKMVHSLEQAGVSGNNRDLWLAAAKCVIKCMADVIIEGEKLIKDSTVKT